MDYLSKARRSEVMATVRGTGTKLEREFCDLLRSEGLRSFRRNVNELPGRPDVVFTSPRIAIFVDSCFWHGCRYHLRKPTTNLEYWKAKIRRNRARDREVRRELESVGWTVVRLWEHQLSRPSSRLRAIVTLRALLDRQGRRS